ncbi:MAG: deoxyribose-phosphate aldolase [Bdellovibrionales bacterium]|nr:deoxyribose-phosphate aldolase [Bdellovibrionales bacterium]
MSLTTPGGNNLAQLIDHTKLNPDMNSKDLSLLCQQAKEHHFFSVCVPPFLVSEAHSLLKDSAVKVCTVIGFPLGYSKTETKALETKLALKDGADEFDMVINNIAVKNKDFESVENDIRSVVEAAKKRTVKVILEISLLTDDEIVKCCEIAVQAGAHFVKTSTGFSSAGASVAAVALMRKTVGENFGVKASGGIRNHSQAEAMVSAGANRLGCSSGIEIISKTQNSDSSGSY